MTCRSTIVQTLIVRVLAALAVGAASFYGANQLAEANWHMQLSLQLALACAAVPAIVTFFATRAVACFTEDCMGIASVALAPGLKETRVDCARGTCARRNPALAQAAGQKLLNQQPSPAAAAGAKITVATEPAENGAVKITVTTNGLSNSRLKGQNGLFQKLNGIGGITWSKHNNIGDGRKQVVGTASAASAQAVLRRLQELAAAYR